ncbi:MAG TPA: family 1 glycosylhydrolase [Opitutaceae bacterium]|nr:family 1 glycosylhydrolase [Opitutaceae bacterium]
MPPPSLSTSRRSFLAQGIGLTAAAFAGPALNLAAEPKSAVDATPVGPTFPADFEWGAATAAIQVEGAASEDGRGDSIWDTFCRQPGRIVDGSSPAITCDHYHRYAADIALLAELGVKHYRFSIAWPRIIPEGRGAVNEKGVDFYRRLVDCLRAHGITPHATLYHWDLPQPLQDRYAGWQSREVAADFADYAAAVVSRLGDRIDRWITLNEITTFALYSGYAAPGGKPPHAPGIILPSPRAQSQIIHHALLAHGLGCQAIRATSPRPCRIAAAENFLSCVPIIETAEHIDAARRAFADSFVNGAILHPLLHGCWDPAWAELHREKLPDVAVGDWKTIAQPLDELGFNCYTGSYFRASLHDRGYEGLAFPAGYPKGGLPWLNIIPDAVYWGVRLVSEQLGERRLPVFLSENGLSDSATADETGFVADVDRIAYSRAYLRQLQRAHAEGYPVSGYYHWSFLDNFEWAEGFRSRFGLVHVDYASQRRTPKLGYHWYRETIRAGHPL